MEIGDPTETALINLGTKLGAEAGYVRGKFPRTSEIPFDSDRKLMSTVTCAGEWTGYGDQRCGGCTFKSCYKDSKG